MIPLELRLSGVRAYGNHAINLGEADVKEVIMFGPNGSGKSTVARMIQALMGDLPSDLHQSYLDERTGRVNKRAVAELTVLNRRDDLWNPDWPEMVVLGLEFGYDNARPFSRFYTEIDGKRQVYRTHQEYEDIFRRPPFNIQPDDRFMFIQQGESTALVQMKPRLRYETMKQFLGLEDLEKRWQDTLDAKNLALTELRNAQTQNVTLRDGLAQKERAWRNLEEFRTLSAEYDDLQRAVAQDELIRHIHALEQAIEEERSSAARLSEETEKQSKLLKEKETYGSDKDRLEDQRKEADKALQEAVDRHASATSQRNDFRRQADDLQRQVSEIEGALSEGLTLEEAQRAVLDLETKKTSAEVDIRAADAKVQGLEAATRESQESVVSLRQSLGRMADDLKKSRSVLDSYGSPESIEVTLEGERPRLAAAQERLALGKERLQKAEREVDVLLKQRTATPPNAIAARDRFIAGGTEAAVLGECVSPPSGMPVEKRRALEGALGELRWAVLVEDGRVLVDYSEYTISDFGGTETLGTGTVPASLPGQAVDLLVEPDGTGGDAAGQTVFGEVTLRGADVPLPDTTSAAKLLTQAAGISQSISDMLARILDSVIFVESHETASAMASKGFVAYTSDGYRYDRYGRRYSVPNDFRLGQEAYEMALKRAEEERGSAQAEVDEALKESEILSQRVRTLEARLAKAQEARSQVDDLEDRIPEDTSRLTGLEEEFRALQSELASVRESLTGLKVHLARTVDSLEAAGKRLEKLQQYGQLPGMKQSLADLRANEGQARREADAAQQERDEIDSKVFGLAQRISETGIHLENVSSRLADIGPRVTDLIQRVEEKRRSLRDVQASSSAIFDAWRGAFGAPGMTDAEVSSKGSEAAKVSRGASEAQRSRWVKRMAEVKPAVLALKDDVIPTAEEDYKAAKERFEKSQSDLERVQAAFEDASGKESIAQDNFKNLMQQTFTNVSARFQKYMERFGWRGHLTVEPIQGTQFELNIHVSVYEGVEPRPLLRNRSGGETSAIAALLTLAMVKEYRRPFYIFDEIDQSLDPANVLRLSAILREELDRKYIIISHRLNKSHLAQTEFGIGVYRSSEEGSKTRIFRRKG
jgi:chromosome segregation ATPase